MEGFGDYVRVTHRPRSHSVSQAAGEGRVARASPRVIPLGALFRLRVRQENIAHMLQKLYTVMFIAEQWQ